MDADWPQAVRKDLGAGHGEREPILEALAGSDLVAFEPAGHDDGERVWNVYWCLPPLDDLSAELIEALRRAPLKFFEERRARARGELWFTRGAYAFTDGSPRHLYVEGAPVAVASLGQVQRFPMPTGLAVPTEFGAITDAVVGAITRLAKSARYGGAIRVRLVQCGA